MNRVNKTHSWTAVPALVVVGSVLIAGELQGFEETKLESGVTVADIEPLKDGQLLMVMDHDGEVRASYSQDNGKTWEASVRLIPKPDGNAGYFHPSLTRAGNGDLLLSYQYYVRGTRPVYKVSYYRRSKDEGKSWGDQLFIASDGLFNDKPICLSTGRLIAPVEREAQVEGGDHAGYVSSVYFSDDDGYSWTKSNEVNSLPTESQEPHVVELKDGRLMMMCRTYSRFVLHSYSTDKGATWSQGEPIRELKLPAWSSALNVKRIPKTGDLLLLRSVGGGAGLRTPFVSVISKDDGKTWINERIIASDPQENYGYPCLLFIDDLAIVGYGSKAGSRVARFPVKWFYEKSHSKACP
jgi:sialidase-1